MTWYLFILLGIIATVLAYRKKQALQRMGMEETNIPERFFATDFGMICCASATLAVVLAFIMKADPTIPQLRQLEETYEQTQYRALGERLASKVKSKANGGKALVITRKPNDANLKQHESFIEGIKAGLGNVQIEKVVFAEFLPEDKEPDEQALPFRLSTAFINRELQRYVNCSVVISTIGTAEDFVTSNLADDISTGKRAFALYTDNVYMQYHAGEKARRLPFNYCVFPNPSFNHRASLAGKTFNFDEHYLELDVSDKNKSRAVLEKHRRMFYYPKRSIVKEEAKK